MLRQFDARSPGTGAVAALLGLTCLLQGATTESLLPAVTSETGVERFQVLEHFLGKAVLDRETQLIWERSPSSRGAVWSDAPIFCALKSVGGRKGWRLPSFLELMTLVQPSARDATRSTPTLPTGHPFRGVEADAYWSLTSLSTNRWRAYAVDFRVGDVTPQTKSRVSRYWCVRGGSPILDDQDHPAQDLEQI